MTIVKKFRADVKDRLGWGYTSALVAVYSASISSQKTYDSAEGDENYTSHDGYEAVAYRANFWGSVEMQQQGLPSRPLINDDNDNDETLFVVDLDHHQSIQVINSGLTPEEKDFRLIELDITRRFA